MPENKARINKFLLKRKYSKKQIKKLYELKYDLCYLFNGVCLSCGSDKDLQLDHIKPVSKYPELTFEYSNLQILCKECNIKKSNTSIIDFRCNTKKYELWNKEQRKMFRYLINKEKLTKPMVKPRILRYKGTLKQYRDGIREEYKERNKIIPELYTFLNNLPYNLDDVLNNRTEKFELFIKSKQ